MSANTAHVDGGLIPLAACLCRVISAVFMQVQKPRQRDRALAVRRTQRQANSQSSLKPTHSGIRLRDTTTHSSQQPGGCGTNTQTRYTGFDFGSGEKQNAAFRGRFNPSL